MTANNPAQRLYEIIKDGKQKPREKAAEEVWAELLGVPKKDKSLLLRRVGYVMALPAAIRESVSAISNIDHEVYLKWLPQVEASFSVLNFQMQWTQFIDRFDGAVVYGLEICSDLLSRQNPEKTLPANTIADLHVHVEELLKEVEGTELPEDVKKYISEHLFNIKSALDEYILLGITPLEREFYATIGSIIINRNIYKQSQESQTGKKFWKLMSNLALMISIAVGTIQIGKDTISLLPTTDEGGAIEHNPDLKERTNESGSSLA